MTTGNCVSRQTHAKGLLAQGFTEAHNNFISTRTYVNKIDATPFNSQTNYYRLEYHTATPDKLDLRAIGINEMAGDEWSVDQDGKKTVVKDLCGRSTFAWLRSIVGI